MQWGRRLFKDYCRKRSQPTGKVGRTKIAIEHIGLGKASELNKDGVFGNYEGIRRGELYFLQL